MAVYDEKSNTYLLSTSDKFRLFSIKHKWVEGVALISNVLPAVTSSFSISVFGYALLLLWWLIGVCPDNNNCFYISTTAFWIVGIIFGIVGNAPELIWIIYFPLFANLIYYIICNILEDRELRQDITPLEILYKQHKIN